MIDTVFLIFTTKFAMIVENIFSIGRGKTYFMNRYELTKLKKKNKKIFKYFRTSEEVTVGTFLLQSLALFLWFYSAMQPEIGLKVILIWVIALIVMKYSWSFIYAFMSLFAAICSFYISTSILFAIYIMGTLFWILPSYAVNLNYILVHKVGFDLKFHPSNDNHWDWYD
jgi:hypothetical protein